MVVFHDFADKDAVNWLELMAKKALTTRNVRFLHVHQTLLLFFFCKLILELTSLIGGQEECQASLI